MNNVEDELALRNLMSRYVDAVNRYDGEAWASTWAEDATWNLLGTDVQGRDNIVGLWQQMMGSFEFALMFPNTCLFEVSGDSASGHWYLAEYTRNNEGERGNILSRYLDTYTRVNGEWLYQSRHYEIMYQGPADLSGQFNRPA